jgi:hypothetical protein
MKGPDSKSTPTNSVIWPELWSAFATHRRQVFEILRTVSPTPTASLCVWGAGRTTDLDLIGLLDHYADITLVDLDPELTQRAMHQRGFTDHPRVTVKQNFDLTGIAHLWSQLETSPSKEKLDELILSAQKAKLDLPQFDVVASTCLLSQIIQNASVAIPTNDANLGSVVRALREQHLRLILDHTKPGGCGMLITDLTSSVAMPALLEEEVDLNQMMQETVNGNHFHGLNPQLLINSTTQPGIADKLANSSVSKPWIWNAHSRRYLCLAFLFKRKP